MLEIHVEYHSGIPVYRQVIAAISAAIADGQLGEGERLPSIRELSDRLGINPNTVAKVYRELELKGLIESRPGSGCFVLEQEEVRLSRQDRLQHLESLWSRLLTDAARLQISEQEAVEYVNRRTHT